MKLICVIDDNGGMMFNHRRQSKDRELRKNILTLAAGAGADQESDADGAAQTEEACKAQLWMNQYTASQFEEEELKGQAFLKISDGLSSAGDQDYVFLEDQPPSEYAEQADELVIYHWNRKYPGDLKFDIDLGNWKLLQTTEFSGFSHEKITREIYVPSE